MTKRYLILEDGTYFEGKALGSDNFRVGDLVFNTSMAGYQEILCDTSYCGQIVVMTYPMIGNYGINRDGFESIAASIFGLVISEHCEMPSNFRSQMTVGDFLKIRNIPAIMDLDTRMIARYIRDHGTMRATLSESIDNLEEQVKAIKETKLEQNLVEMVSITKPFHIPANGKRVVLVDFGSINEILRELNLRKMDISVVPYDVDFQEIESLHVDAVVLSNGPGNPMDLPQVIETVKSLIGSYPVLGIGLGHQLLALASGAEIEKLKVGHRGANYPIKNMETGKTAIRSTNNSYTVGIESLKNTGLSIAYMGAEGTCEGLVDHDKKLYSVQFHPGQIVDDSCNNEVYETFMQMIDDFKEGKNA